MRKSWHPLVAAVAALLAVIAAPPASADPVTPSAVNVLTFGSDGGPNVLVGDDIRSFLKSGTTATFFTSSTNTSGIICTSSTFQVTVTNNPMAPGTATESLHTQNFSGCTHNLPGVISVIGLTVDNLPYDASTTSAGAVTVTGGATGPIRTTVELFTVLGLITCHYQAVDNTVRGTGSDADNSVTFTRQQSDLVDSPSNCSPSGFFSAVYAPIRDIDQPGSPLVFMN